jgi:hypothetical protein
MFTADQVALAGGVFALLAGVLALVKESRDSRHLRAQIEILKSELEDCRNGAPPPAVSQAVFALHQSSLTRARRGRYDPTVRRRCEGV